MLVFRIEMSVIDYIGEMLMIDYIGGIGVVWIIGHVFRVGPRKIGW